MVGEEGKEKKLIWDVTMYTGGKWTTARERKRVGKGVGKAGREGGNLGGGGGGCFGGGGGGGWGRERVTRSVR